MCVATSMHSEKLMPSWKCCKNLGYFFKSTSDLEKSTNADTKNCLGDIYSQAVMFLANSSLRGGSWGVPEKKGFPGLSYWNGGEGLLCCLCLRLITQGYFHPIIGAFLSDVGKREVSKEKLKESSSSFSCSLNETAVGQKTRDVADNS